MNPDGQEKVSLRGSTRGEAILKRKGAWRSSRPRTGFTRCHEQIAKMLFFKTGLTSAVISIILEL